MSIELKNEDDAIKYFEKAAASCCPAGIVLYHNQRKTVLEVLKAAAEKTGRKFIEQDLSLLQEDQIGTKMFENEVPGWLKGLFEGENKGGYLVYLREFHFAADRVKNDAMNFLIIREVESAKLPENTLIVLGVLDVEDVTSALKNTNIVKFYRQV